MYLVSNFIPKLIMQLDCSFENDIWHSGMGTFRLHACWWRLYCFLRERKLVFRGWKSVLRVWRPLGNLEVSSFSFFYRLYRPVSIKSVTVCLGRMGVCFENVKACKSDYLGVLLLERDLRFHVITISCLTVQKH